MVDAAGNFYVAANNGTVMKLNGGETIVASGLGGSNSLAVDGAGTVYIADPGNNRVLRIPVKGMGASGTIGSGLSRPSGVAVDGEGNVFIVDSGNNRVVESQGGTGFQFTIASGLNQPLDVAVDGLGNVYIAEVGNVVKVSANGTQTTLGTGLSVPQGVAVDAGGDVYVADSGLGQVVKITPSGQQTIGTGLVFPYSVALDGAGDVFISDWEANHIIEIQQSLPPSTLNFASIPVGSTSDAQSVTVQNIGNQPLNTTSLSVSGSNFEQIENTGTLEDCHSTITLAGGEGCNLSIIFWPPSIGSFSGSAVLTDNTSNSTSASQTIKLTGAGTNP